MTRPATTPDGRSLFSFRDPRPWLRCLTCEDFGMIEDAAGREDACPTCEGGIWRDREPWGSWLNRHLPGFRVCVGWPFIYRTTTP